MQRLRLAAIVLLPLAALVLSPARPSAQETSAQESPAQEASEVCIQMIGQMYALTVKYRAAMVRLNASEREFEPAAARGAEAALRAVRGYDMQRRDIGRQRETMIALYRDLVDAGCAPFDAEGLEVTRHGFARLGSGEQATARAAHERAFGQAQR